MKQFRWVVLLACTFLIGGCSSFPREYAEAKAKLLSSSSINGPWEGEWVSKGGHRGELRCLLSESASRRDIDAAVLYDARFEAKFWGIFTAHYAVQLVRSPAERETIVLVGDQDLGGLGGGIYHYEAIVTSTSFDTTYRSDMDQGVFHMVRPVKRN